MIPNMAGFDEFKNIMMSFPVSDAFLFAGVARTIREYVLSLI